MVTRLGRRAFELAVGVFAVLGFMYVPLGQKTGFAHLKAVLGTREAKQAGRDLVEAAGDVRRQVFEALPDPTDPETAPSANPATRPHKDGQRKEHRPTPKTAARQHEPAPEVPKLAKVDFGDAGVDASLDWTPPKGP